MSRREPQPRLISGLGDVAKQYDAALVDIWGVLHNGVRPNLGAPEACKTFRDNCGPVILVSNSPRPRDGVIKQLRGLGVPDDAYDGVITSGDATRAELAKRAPGPVYAISPDKDMHIYDGLDLTFTDVEEAAFVSVTGLFDDGRETPLDYAEMLTKMRARRLDMVCANPDIVVDIGGTITYCAGAIAQAYEAIGGQVVMSGKPHRPIYDLAIEALGEIMGDAPSMERIVAIGDGPLTDLRGANALGIDAVFVVSGMHREALDGTPLTAKAAAQIANEADAWAKYTLPGLRW